LQLQMWREVRPPNSTSARGKIWHCQNWLCIARFGLADADPKRQYVTR
jgi:hypothetical protein